MPLSEEEQRILHQIEQQFYESDPQFAANVGQASLYRHALHRIAWASLMLVVGLVFLVFTLQVHLALAFCGFLVMLTAAFIIDKNARAIGRAGFDQVTGRVRGSRQRDGQGGTARPVDTDD
jgi:ABC-type multidrug transport system fused ATPase/permease subunit